MELQETSGMYQEGSAGKPLARGLGWFSIGLGIAATFAPRQVSKVIGVEGHESIVQMVGVRELVAGIGMLSKEKPAGWAWARLAGDVMDLSLLVSGFSDSRSHPARLTLATAAVGGVALLDLICAQELSGSLKVMEDSSIEVKKTITVNRPAHELYSFWRNLENLGSIMPHLESVTVIDERRSHWVAKAPAGLTVKWDAEIIADSPNEYIAWRSIEGSEVWNEGSVRFSAAPANRGTEITVHLRYIPPAGVLGASIAKLFGRDPEKQIRDDLRPFKQLMETGEVATTQGQSAGRASGETWMDRLTH